MIQTVSKDIEWEAAHRLINGYPGNCKNNHGHSWKATVVLMLHPGGYHLNNFGFVRDFSDFKPLKQWVMDNWDHATLVSNNDKTMLKFLKAGKQRHYVFGTNPTSEHIAIVLMNQASNMLNDERTKVVEVRIRETCTSEAVVKYDAKDDGTWQDFQLAHRRRYE